MKYNSVWERRVGRRPRDGEAITLWTRTVALARRAAMGRTHMMEEKGKTCSSEALKPASLQFTINKHEAGIFGASCWL